MKEQQLEKEAVGEGGRRRGQGGRLECLWKLGLLGQGEALHGALGLPPLPHLGPPWPG